ncbi:Glucanosyltransferase-domain-containing protein [Podospora australis]|uniref:1,3-beta-glucanosyltransferase n=1 Tax=Podospora australis TaxID=1536484 RepID=A0AAN6WT53_9PEZI|nr:Glucanosyltransferase-domain-containing protein [Podospora australis]
MMLSSNMFSLCAALFLLPSLAFGLSPISVKGTKLYDGDGNQFFLKGVVYVGGEERLDPLLDTNQCKVDAAVISDLGANAIYIYSIDAGELGKHKGCMDEFAKAGIYVWLQLGQFPQVTSRSAPTTWTLSLFQSWTSIIDSFSAFDNLLAFGIGQETINSTSLTTLTAPHIKAAARDLKAFQNARTYRKIPISYSAGDFESYRLLTAQYLSCGPAENTIDLFGINLFNNCSDTKYDRLRSEFANHNTPVVLSEDGCMNLDTSRSFSEVTTMMGEAEFQSIFSGMNIYQWGRDEYDFALVTYTETLKNTGQPVTKQPYEDLQGIWSSIKPTTVPMASYSVASSRLACPTPNSAVGWLPEANAALPAISGLTISTVTPRTFSTTRTSTATSGAVHGTETNAGASGSETTPGAVTGDQKSGISGGAIAGIVIGILAVVAGLGFLAFWMTRRKRSRLDADAPYEKAESDRGKFELPDQQHAAAEMPGGFQHHQLATKADWKYGYDNSPDTAVSEMPDGNRRPGQYYELPVASGQPGQPHFELEGSTVDGSPTLP